MWTLILSILPNFGDLLTHSGIVILQISGSFNTLMRASRITFGDNVFPIALGESEHGEHQHQIGKRYDYITLLMIW